MKEVDENAGKSFALGPTLGMAYESLKEQVESLISHIRSGATTDGPAIVFESMQQSLHAYTNGLAQVRESFLATTTLSSSFWSGENLGIIEANLSMLGKLQKTGAKVRRLFLLHLPPKAEIQSWQDHYMSLVKADDQAGLKELHRRFANLRRHVESLGASGCEVRAIHDGDRRHGSLPVDLGFDPRLCELAIYDAWRLDVFSGDRPGTLQRVSCFTPALDAFPEMLEQTRRYFDQLWEESTEVGSLLERIAEAIEYSAQRINYPPVWLSIYDHGLPEDDRLLKAIELNSVKTELRKRDSWGNIHRFLDVGTCTARYPISLADAVRRDGQIIGIDNDRDCVQHSSWNVSRLRPEDPRLSIRQQNFTHLDPAAAGKFELVTCMLSTLVHFGYDRNQEPPYEDSLQASLVRFRELLTDDGVFFFSVWTEEASENRNFLCIYSQEDMEQLAKWVLPQAELSDRLDRAGFRHQILLRIEDRLDLYCCTR